MTQVKLFHTADWHLGKLVQGVYMTDDQRHVIEQFIAAIEEERPDAVIIAGDLYDRGVPPTEAVDLLNEVLERIVMKLDTPVLAIAGNHDSPDRISFGTGMMEDRGLHLAGQVRPGRKPVVLRDEHGEVHFHLMPYADPSIVRHALEDESIRSHNDAARVWVSRMQEEMDDSARHVLIGHLFATPSGEQEPNTSESERPLAIGGAEHVSAVLFERFHYTALGHLHQSHYVKHERIRYAGSLLKYSISEERHDKGFYIVHLDAAGEVTVEKRSLQPRRDMRRVVASIEELENHAVNEDYVYVTLLNEHPVLFPMEKVRAVYPNAMHVERRLPLRTSCGEREDGAVPAAVGRREQNPVELFAAFYEEVNGTALTDEKRELFARAYDDQLREEGEGR